MTKRDDEDAGLALVSGSIGALLTYGKLNPTIQNLEAQNRDLQSQNIRLQHTISAKDEIIAQKDAEIKKLREELQKKGNASVKNIAKSFFDKI